MNKQGKINEIFIGGYWQHNACLNFASDGDYSYAEGYKRAGDILVSYVKNKVRYQDFLVYPIIFLYRQSIELKLKIIIGNGSALLGISSGNIGHHDVKKLWSRSKKILLHMEPECEADLLRIEKIILAMYELDPSSYVSRYSTDKKGDATLSSDSRIINLTILADEIARAYSFLDGADSQISYLSEQKVDIV